MDILSFLSDSSDHRILLAKNTSAVNALIRQYHIETSGVKIMSLSSLAQEIVSYHDAKENRRRTFLTNEYAFVVFERMMQKQIHSFPYYEAHQHLLDQETLKEVFRVVNIVRAGDTPHTDAADFTQNEQDQSRIRDCFAIAQTYASQLEENGMIDQTGMLLLAEKEVSKWQENEMALVEITCLKEDMMEFSDVENKLVSALQKVTQTKIESVHLPDAFRDFLEDRKRDNVSFFKGFGSVNEVKYCIYDVLKHGYPFGDISIQYVSQADITTIQTELDRNHIPYCFTDQVPAWSNPVVEWVNHLLAWAENDYEEKYLETLLLNRMFTRTEETVRLLPANLLKQIASGSYAVNDQGSMKRVDYFVGWSLQRYEKMIQLLQGCADNLNFSTEKRMEYAFLASFMKDLTGIFQSDLTLSALFGRILQFLETYYTGDPLSYLSIRQSLHDLHQVYAFMDNNELSLSEIIDRIQDDLKHLSLADEEKADAVQVQCLSRFHVLERKQTYVIGMSAVNMKNASSQSPILSDAELKYFVHGSYLPISENVGPLQQEKIKMTLASNPESSLHLGFNFFDTQEKSECTPAVIYLELLSLHQQNADEIPFFEYGLPKTGIAPMPRPIAAVQKMDNPDLFASYTRFSATSLETLSECPRKFCYRYLQDLEPLEYYERHPSRWLDARNKGNLIHSILEQYTRQVFQYTSDVSYDANVFRNILNSVVCQYEAIVPSVERWIMNYQVRQIGNQIEQYLQELHEEYNHSPWNFLLAECAFYDTVLHDVIDLNLVGKIDRIDYRIDESTKTIYLRTIDYKTGRKTNIEKKVTVGEAQQRRVYTTALMQENLLMQMKHRIKKLNPHVRFPEYRFAEDGFYYVFIGDEETDEDTLVSLTAKKAVLNDADDEASSYRLSNMIQHCLQAGEFLDRFTIGEMMEQNYEYDEFSLKEGVIANLRGPMGKRGNKRNKCDTKCTYCPFGQICDAYRS